MTWREIRNLFKRLDSNLTEAVYLHGCYLTGQEKTIRHSREDEVKRSFTRTVKCGRQSRPPCNARHQTSKTIDALYHFPSILNCHPS